ncbi:MAG TPA: efflux RND transporter periplasmic adaptor subunit, partial [Kofleriaceae bacterium]|nr:efflux RND transporter periplasmic adaptor subunit [Kofleriaceae bacterium]
ALDNHRRRGQEGVVTELSPGWIRATYYFLLAALAVGIVVSIVVHVPTYSSGYGVVMYPGTPMTAPAPGTVDKIYVEAQTDVKRGMPLVKLKSEKEESDYKQANTELDAALQSYLFDPADESIRKALVSAQASARRAADAIEQRTVRATVDGTVSDVRVAEGKSVNFGDPILTIVAPGTQPELWALMPGNDRPRFRIGQEMQVELTGFQKKREHAKIFDIALSNTGTTMARNLLGVELADSLKLSPEGGNYVLVKAKLPKNTFKAKGKLYRYYTGMATKIEVKVEDKRFISTLLPSLEKYVE